MSDACIWFSDAPPPSRETLPSLLGGKGASLSVMSAKLGLPVPPAFTIAIPAFHIWRKKGSLDFLRNELQGAVAGLERRLDRRFGGTVRPLIVSVRSGAPVSMPGMMDTILNLGLNESTQEALASELGAPIAREAYSRFRAMFTKIVGHEPPEEPWRQLEEAIVAVFASWDSPRAKTYRTRAAISDDLGTAVTVQAMVFGTATGFSGTGVAFTRDPSTGEPVPTGDWLANAQGEDVVGGTRATQPLSALQGDAPVLWRELMSALDTLEAHYQDLCDVEFTIESGRLWILQARAGKRSARAAVRIAVDRALDPKFTFDKADAIAAVSEGDVKDVLGATALFDGAQALTVGLGASPGVAKGRVYFTADDAVDAAARGEKVILVRSETSPEDIHGMDAAEGILTATGGMVSHAAIVAREWGKPAVVGASEIAIGDGDFSVGAQRISEGDAITLDGSTGAVYLGAVAENTATVDPALSTLLDWARQLTQETGDGLADYSKARAIILANRIPDNL